MKITTDHDEIRQWVEQFVGKPQLISDPQAKADETGLRFDFPGKTDEFFLPTAKVHDISWYEFFKIFEQQKLAFLYDENTDPDVVQKLDQGYHFIRRSILHGNKDDELQEIDTVMKEFMRYDSVN